MDWIVEFLKGRDWTSPTEIGTTYGKSIKSTNENYHSSWASPKCKKLVEKGILERNSRGWYRLLKK